MIDARNVNEKQGTIYCEACEKRLGVPVEFVYDITDQSQMAKVQRSASLKRFYAVHDECKSKEDKDLDARIDSYLPQYDDKVKFATACYAEDPKMPFAEIQRRWEGLQAIKKDLPVVI